MQKLTCLFPVGLLSNQSGVAVNKYGRPRQADATAVDRTYSHKEELFDHFERIKCTFKEFVRKECLNTVITYEWDPGKATIMHGLGSYRRTASSFESRTDAQIHSKQYIHVGSCTLRQESRGQELLRSTTMPGALCNTSRWTTRPTIMPCVLRQQPVSFRFRVYTV